MFWSHWTSYNPARRIKNSNNGINQKKHYELQMETEATKFRKLVRWPYQGQLWVHLKKKTDTLLLKASLARHRTEFAHIHVRFIRNHLNRTEITTLSRSKFHVNRKKILNGPGWKKCPVVRCRVISTKELINHFNITHKAPYLLPKILHKHCFQFLLGGQIRCIMGNVEVAYSPRSIY